MRKRYLAIVPLIVGLFASFAWCESAEYSHLQLGDQYLEQGKLVKAISEYKEAIKKNPKDATACHNLGLAYYHSGETKQAIKYYKKALRIDPDNFSTYRKIGFAYDRLSKYKQAIKYYEKAVEIKPDDPMTYYNIGVAYGFLRQHKQAIKSYEKALEKDPNYASAYNNLGFSYTQLGRHEEAIKYYEKALQIDSLKDNAYYNIGFANSELNRHEEAIKYYEKALQVNPNYANAYYHLGAIYRESGQYQKAEKNDQIAKKLFKISDAPNMSLVTNFSERRSTLGLSILPPRGEGWCIVQSPYGGLNFAKLQDMDAHTYGCKIVIIPLDVDEKEVIFSSPNEFLQDFKKKEIDVDKKRFKDVESNYNLTSRFGAYCVEYQVKCRDVKYRDKDNTPLIMKMHGYCFIHPKDPKYRVEIEYSERGASEEFTPSFEKIGNKFIDDLIIEE